ncbi:MAG: signal recognition particle-docking protein FtsY [Bdellovibrio sp.]|nr:MAG: signal recognition particle-docking protein FtsY [Bdellovibrio sp.]
MVDDFSIWVSAGVGVVVLLLVIWFFKKKKKTALPESPKESHKKTVSQPLQEKKGVDLKEVLKPTRNRLMGRIQEVLGGERPSGLKEEDIEALEEVLYTSDLGPRTVQHLVEALHQKKLHSLDEIKKALKDEMEHFFESSINEDNELKSYLKKQTSQYSPLVWMIVGVNGVGKTTTIGKLAQQAKEMGLKVLVVAGDTFRAAAEDQLKVWSQRAGVDFFSPEGVKDPSAVVYDGLQKARSQGYDFVVIDTAGRLHTQEPLMEELKKVKRVMKKVLPEAPHETLLVLDANTGQNALMQAHKFHEALELTGVILTKLDGTAKGGVAVGVACELGLPIRFVGVGEGVHDLIPFRPKEFVESIL